MDSDSDVDVKRQLFLKNDDKKEEEEEERMKWGQPIEYYLCVLGFAVGFGSLWRFPYLVFANGGGAFLFPYLVCFLIIATPGFFLETSLGQMIKDGVARCFGFIKPAYRGVGIAAVLICYFEGIYYNVLMAYALVFLYDSFEDPLPWKVEDPEDGKVWDEKYFYDKVLHKSESLDNLDGFNPRIMIAIIISYIILYLCIIKGIKSTGKVAYVSAPAPYIFLFILLIRGLFLDGSWDGIAYLFQVDWSKVWSFDVWAKAASQVLFQCSIGQGALIMFASYKEKNESIKFPSWFVPWVTCATGILCAFTVFAYMGYMAHESGLSIDDLPLSGPDLVFVAYPAALTLMPWSNLWSVLFFMMVFFLGVDTEFAFLETLSSHLEDEKIKIFGKKFPIEIMRFFMVILMFLGGLVLYTNGGFYYLPFYDTYAVNVTIMLTTLLECVIVSKDYGWDKLEAMIKQGNEEDVSVYIRTMTGYGMPIVLPVLIAGALWHELIDLQNYPWWACILALIMIFLPIYFIFREFLLHKKEQGSEDLKAPLIELEDIEQLHDEHDQKALKNK